MYDKAGDLVKVTDALDGTTDRSPEYQDKYGGHFWARWYYVETVGNVNEEMIMRYIAKQEESDRIGGWIRASSFYEADKAPSGCQTPPNSRNHKMARRGCFKSPTEPGMMILSPILPDCNSS